MIMSEQKQGDNHEPHVRGGHCGEVDSCGIWIQCRINPISPRLEADSVGDYRVQFLEPFFSISEGTPPDQSTHKDMNRSGVVRSRRPFTYKDLIRWPLIHQT